jgi:di/tricarboxylate transporter
MPSKWFRPASSRIWFVIVIAAAAGALAGFCFAGRSGLSSRRLLVLVPEAAAIAIFAMTYLVVAIGRLPGFRIDRAGAALVGASLMVAAGALPLEEAPKAIDFDTIILLLGVMIVVANLRLSGFSVWSMVGSLPAPGTRSRCSARSSWSREFCRLFW